LLSSEDEGDDAPAVDTQPASGRVPSVDVDGLFVSGAGLTAAAAGVGGGVRLGTLMCPVCCLEFQQLGALNAHLDECLL
jgi:hypothetical protein